MLWSNWVVDDNSHRTVKHLAFPFALFLVPSLVRHECIAHSNREGVYLYQESAVARVLQRLHRLHSRIGVNFRTVPTTYGAHNCG